MYEAIKYLKDNYYNDKSIDEVKNWYDKSEKGIIVKVNKRSIDYLEISKLKINADKALQYFKRKHTRSKLFIIYK